MATEKRDKEEEEVKTDDGSLKIKPRPIVQLGIFLVAHSPVFSVVFSAAGVLALLILPLLAKNTYISENALMPGSARSMLSNRDVSDGSKLVKDIKNYRLNHEGQVQKLIGKYMSEMGAEVYYQKFHPEGNQFHPLHFFSGPDSYTLLDNVSCASYGVNVAGIIRAPRGDGKESIVLVTPYDFINGGDYEALSLGITGTLFSLLARVTWLSKDIIWLVADSRYGDYRPVAAWLTEYHSPSFKDSDLLKCGELNTADKFRRAGTMAAALVLKVDGRSERFEDTLSIYAEASNGQMPNLDLINVVNYLAVHRQGFYVKVEKVVSLLSSSWLKIIGEIFEAVGKLAHTLNPDWNFGIPTADYLEGSATLASSLYSQALGIPTGPHGAFRDYQVDAITLKVSPRFPPDSKTRQHDFFLRGAKLLEGTIRSVNNLLEKFHQSFFLYLLTSPSKFISVGVYMIAFALLVASLPMVAASLYIDGCKALNNSTLNPAGNFKSWKWLDAAKQVFALHLFGLIVTLLPYFICQVPGQHSPSNRSIMWGTTSSSLLLITFATIPGCSPFSSRRHGTNWAVLKSVTISAAFIGLCLMSIINFATAEIGALLLVPTCLIVQPIKPALRSRRIKSLLGAFCSMVLLTIGFPVMLFAISKGLFGEGLVGLSLGGEFWTWLESLWAWKSATYLYIGMVHLPCWLLCLCILFHPS
ncbi:PREDICTED: glycosylphosphatidylinositol anchor attachment 1 protein isoform X2 [Camelina sativa]|uniref:Glycosylphosphatidylinositol anchor attachment 1 protein isoform X2 n=1 Tax=Camelina sativa TaxID=90675 RepID=A0ABM0XYU0_CAMSA|nr:PREDICTED: glycosylphosphatidylinositol anchor attachment 1 protein isoform X2 [Camelina sativa]